MLICYCAQPLSILWVWVSVYVPWNSDWFCKSANILQISFSAFSNKGNIIRLFHCGGWYGVFYDSSMLKRHWSIGVSLFEEKNDPKRIAMPTESWPIFQEGEACYDELRLQTGRYSRKSTKLQLEEYCHWFTGMELWIRLFVCFQITLLFADAANNETSRNKQQLVKNGWNRGENK